MTALRFVGKLLISVGVGFLLFCAWTLWGTGLYTDRQQSRLFDAYAAQPPVHSSAEEPGGPPAGFRPSPGDPLFRLLIPRIDLDNMVVAGVDRDHLRMGPGFYPACRRGFELCLDFDETYPGEEGRVIIAGHRTTYGGPFYDLDALEEGDEIVTETSWGTFTYVVRRLTIVDAGSRGIVIPGEGSELILSTCHPRFSAAQRLVVFASLKDEA